MLPDNAAVIVCMRIGSALDAATVNVCARDEADVHDSVLGVSVNCAVVVLSVSTSVPDVGSDVSVTVSMSDDDARMFTTSSCATGVSVTVLVTITYGDASVIAAPVHAYIHTHTHICMCMCVCVCVMVCVMAYRWCFGQ